VPEETKLETPPDSSDNNKGPFNPHSNAWVFQQREGQAATPPTQAFQEALANHPSTNH
jgi:hypothetical protein